MRHYRTGIIFTLLVALLSVAAAQANTGQCYPGQVGVGVSISQWAMPYVDIVKESRGFERLFDTTPFALDADGWPTTDARLTILETWPVAEWWGQIDDPEGFRARVAGLYPGRFTGQAEMTRIFGDFAIRDQVYDAASNTTTFTLEMLAGGNGVAIIGFQNTRRQPSDAAGSGLLNLKVVRPGYALDSAPVFNQTFLNLIASAPFSTLRFMGYTNTNAIDAAYPATIDWAERRRPSAATYSGDLPNHIGGGPWEDVVALSNQMNINPWINVPASATDDYIRQLATLFRDQLEPERILYVEYSNEVWNWAFPQSQWNQANAQAQGLNYIQGYAKRTAEIALIFREVFGAGSLNNRVRVMNAWQVGWNPPDAQYEEQMQTINATFGPPNTLIWSLSVAPYFNCYGANGCGADVPGLIAGMQASSDESAAARALVKTVADRWALPGGLTAYEGGSDTGLGFTENVANRILSARTPEMGALIKRDLLQNWFEIGGGLFMQLELVGPYSRFGTWGLTDDVFNADRNSKFQAIRDVLCDDPTVATPTPAFTSTPTLPATSTPEPTLAPSATLLPSFTPTPVTTGPALRVVVEPASASIDQTVQVSLKLEGVAGLYGLEAQCAVDPAVLVGVSSSDGAVFTAANSFFVDPGFTPDGNWSLAATLLNPAPAFSGDGVAFTLGYRVVGVGQTAITCSALAVDSNGSTIDVTIINGQFTGDAGTQPTATFTATLEPTLEPSATLPPEPTATFTPTSVPTIPPTVTLMPTILPPTATPVASSLQGVIRYQARPDHSGIMLTLLAGGPNGTTFAQGVTNADGSFRFDNLFAGTYALQIFGEGHLSAVYTINVPAEGATLPLVTLRAGDTDGNQVIDLVDAALIGANFRLPVPPGPVTADLNRDGVINISDLVLLGGNFGLRGPISLP